MKPITTLFVVISITLLATGIVDSAWKEIGFSNNMWSDNRLSSNQLSPEGHSNESSHGVSISMSNGISGSIVSDVRSMNRGDASNISKPIDASSAEYKTKIPPVNISSMAREKALSEFFNDYVEWCMDNSDSTTVHDIEIYSATNQKDNTVSYLNGILRYSDETGVFEGTCKQYFNNRMWNLDTLTNPYQKAPPIILYPFDPTKTDTVDLAIDTTNGILTINHVSGGGDETVDLQIANRLIFGLSGSGSQSMYVISLSKHESRV